MCGIVGVFHYGEPDRAADRGAVARMLRLLAHRGPDDEGVFADGPVALGNRRLAIVDLSPTGHQPMCDEGARHWITYNGEFYDHARFRERLLAAGHAFRGTSDTETMLHLLAADGPAALRDASGIFALALWDSRERRLLLVRDPLGVKQLYYHDDGRRIVFASEIKALFEHDGVPRALDPDGLNEYLHFHTTLFERTFFREIRQLCQGEFLEVSANGTKRGTYWSVERFDRLPGSPDRHVEELRGLLATVVKDQLLADVPVGSFFSGGIDSSAVASYASRAGEPPECFGVHFTGQGVIDERPYQEAAARALGLRIHLITLDGSSFPDDLFTALYYQDQPVIGPALLPMYHVSALAARHVKVCLGGQAADEVFGGYARYALVRPLAVARGWLGARGSTGNGSRVGGNLRKQLFDGRNLRRLAMSAVHLGDWQERYFAHFAKVPAGRWVELVAAPEMRDRARARETFREGIATSPATDPADKVMHWDMRTFLPGLFHQDDRMSMAHGLESRVPLADRRVVEFAFRCGFGEKFHAGATKWLLRRAVADVLPADVLNRRKAGFDTPAESWMRGPHRAFVRELVLSDRARSRGLWNMAALERAVDADGDPFWFDIVWKIINIEAWARIFLDGDVSPRLSPLDQSLATATV